MTINVSERDWEFIGRSWMRTSASKGFSPDTNRMRERSRLISGSPRGPVLLRWDFNQGSSIIGCTRLREGYGEAGMAIHRFTGEVLDKTIEVVNE